MNSNGTLELTGLNPEPVTSTVNTFEQISGNWFEKSVTTETAQGGSGAGTRTTTSLRLLGGALYDVDIQYTSDGLATTRVTTRDPDTRTVTTTVTTNRADQTQTATQTSVNGLLVSQTVPGASGSIEHDYDALERPTVVKDLAGIRRRTVYDDVPDSDVTKPALARSLVKEEQVKAADAAEYTTERSYAYHGSTGQPGYGRVATVTQADGTTLSYAYDLRGHQTFTGGSGTYPVRYQYDDYGELWKMHTFRSGTPTAASTGDVTTWTRDDATGILLSKTDAASAGVSTTYDPASGRVWKRTLARSGAGGAPITITYTYDDAGRLTHIDYSDDTPDVIHTYYTDGRLKTTLDAAGLHTYDYSGPNGALKGETISGTGLLAGSSWSTTFDTAARVDVYTWTWTGAGSRSIDYDYDSAGRLSKVSAFGHSATYGYDPATGRKETLTYSGAGLTGTWSHDTRGRLDAISWKVGANVLSRHDYGFDALHRRTSAERENGETWRYGYNDRGEVESAVKKADNTTNAAAKRGLQSGYGYDLIGNRIMDQQHTPSSGNSLSQAVWTANALNQITERENHDSRRVFGHVKEAATLTVTGNSGEVIREGEEFAIPVSRTGAATDADWHSLEVTATLAGAGRVVDGTPMDVTTQRQGKVWFPTSPEDLQYDDDGNLTQDGRWNFTWNAENRLIRAETREDVATATGMPRQRLDMAYDAMGRRIRKAVYQLETLNLEPETWVLKSDLRFLYEGTSWNLVAELNLKPETSNLELIRSYAWGTDISGTMDGAGGVGGLLFVQQLSTTVNNSQPSSTVSAPCYDGNGNISAYVRVQSGTVSSRHDYDAFGRPVWNELEGTGGRQVAASPFGFSTKYTDVETGWCYYGKRYYAPELGRWPSRDPIEEQGGINLYGMVGNDPVNQWDYLGWNYGSTGVIGQKPNCEVILRISHGPGATTEWYLKWLRSVEVLAQQSKLSPELVTNGMHPFYGSVGIIACHQPAMDRLWTPGVKGNPPLTEKFGPGKMGPPDPRSGGHVGPSNRSASDSPIYPKSAAPFTNGGHGHTNQAYLEYIKEALVASLQHASKLAKDCALDSCCQCKQITMKFVIDENAYGGNMGLNSKNAYKHWGNISKEPQNFNDTNQLSPGDFPGLNNKNGGTIDPFPRDDTDYVFPVLR